MNCVLGLDGGGTKTKGVVCNERGHVLGSGTAGPSNYQVVGKEQVKASLAEAAARAIEAAGIEREDVSAVCLGMAGLDSQTDYDVIWCLVQEIDLPGEVHLVNDAVVALAGATAGRPGVVVNAGTGAIAFGVNEQGESRRASGWGHILGDEGSGYDIGRRGIIASLRAHDGRGPATSLVHRLCQHFGLAEMEDIIALVYRREMPPSQIAAFAPVVTQAAREGDEVAAEILCCAGRELALAALAVLQGLGMEGMKVEVAVVGGTLEADEFVQQSFEEAIKREASHVQVIAPRFEPAVGAALLALQQVCKGSVLSSSKGRSGAG